MDQASQQSFHNSLNFVTLLNVHYVLIISCMAFCNCNVLIKL